MRNLQARYPEIRFNLFSGHFDDVAEKLDKGLLDFGLIIEPANLTKYASIRLPVMESLGVLMLKDSPLARQESIRPEDLWDKPLIFSTPDNGRKPVIRLVEKGYGKAERGCYL